MPLETTNSLEISKQKKWDNQKNEYKPMESQITSKWYSDQEDIEKTFKKLESTYENNPDKISVDMGDKNSENLTKQSKDAIQLLSWNKPIHIVSSVSINNMVTDNYSIDLESMDNKDFKKSSENKEIITASNLDINDNYALLNQVESLLWKNIWTHINSNTTVENSVTTSDIVKSTVNGYISNLKVNPLDNGKFEISFTSREK